MMNVTAVIVGLNEANHLNDCLSGLTWCNKIFYYDMGSIDDSIEIAKKYTNDIKVIDHFSCVEKVHEKYCNEIDCDLILITDPDEVLTPEMVSEVKIALSKFDLKTHSELRANMYYFFKHKKLIGTFWGGKYSARFIFNKNFLKFTGLIHDGTVLSKINPLDYNWGNSSYIKHYWTKGWSHLYKKHKRYLKGEGESMYSRGLVYSIKNQLKESYFAFYFSYWAKKGIKDGFIGLGLSLFWAWYTFKRWSSLNKFEKRVIKNEI